MKKIINGTFVSRGKLYADKELYVKDGCFVSPEAGEVTECFNAHELIISEGFTDTHLHGGGGFDFADGDAVGNIKAALTHLAHGSCSIYPTVYSTSFSTTMKALSALRKSMEMPGGESIRGVHLEGPYFSPAQCGAQDPSFITPPIKEDYERLISEYGDIIKRWSYAPERDLNQSFTKALIKHDIVPSAAHTDATYSELYPAYEEGCRLVTHLYSCTSTVTRQGGFRRAGVIESAFLLDDMDIELIADGKHLPPELIRLVYKVKGADRIMLVSDSLKAAGENTDHTYIGTGDRKLLCPIEDGVCKLPDRKAFAGSIATGDILLKTALDAGIALADAVKMLTDTPARIMRQKTNGKAIAFDKNGAGVILL